MSGSSLFCQALTPKIQPWSISDVWKPILLHCILESLKWHRNHTWKVNLMYMLLTWYTGRGKPLAIPRPPQIHQGINWFNTHNHIKISWQVQFRYCFTCLTLSLEAFYHWDPPGSGNSAISLTRYISSSWWRASRWVPFLRPLAKTNHFADTLKAPGNQVPPLQASVPFYQILSSKTQVKRNS